MSKRIHDDRKDLDCSLIVSKAEMVSDNGENELEPQATSLQLRFPATTNFSLHSITFSTRQSLEPRACGETC